MFSHAANTGLQGSSVNVQGDWFRSLASFSQHRTCITFFQDPKIKLKKNTNVALSSMLHVFVVPKKIKKWLNEWKRYQSNSFKFNKYFNLEKFA